jgi:signal transduction histidine kinase
MDKCVLLVSTMKDAKEGAALVAEQLGFPVEVAPGRREALTALRHAEYAVVVIEESLAESDAEWAGLVWQHAGLAVPMEVNFSITARSRLVREIRSALSRRQQETELARKEAARTIGNELKSSVTGLLLQTQLAQRSRGIPAELAPKLQHLVELATEIRERLQQDLR